MFRCRKHSVYSKENEASTWSLGTPHNVETFHTINFAAPRAVTAGNRHELDTRLWRNGTFNEPASKVRIPKGWKTDADKMPARWGLSDGYTGEFQYQLHPGSTDNYFVTLSGGYLGNDCEIKSDKIAASCRMRGKGKMRFCMLRYNPGKEKPADNLRACAKKSIQTEWKTFSFEFRKTWR